MSHSKKSCPHPVVRSQWRDSAQSRIQNRESKISRGFTLIELLTVITIIGILAAIILPTVSRVRKTARKVQCANNMRQIATAMMLYANDHRGKLPVAFDEKNERWDSKLRTYLDIVILPGGSTSGPSPVFKCPEDPRPLVVSESPAKWARSYTLMRANDSENQWALGIGVFGSVGGVQYSRNLSELAFPSKSVMFTELFTDSSGAIVDNYQYSGSLCISTGWVADLGYKVCGRIGGGFYHGNAVNFAFADGHIESTNPKNINTSAFNHFRAW
ncbi:MAG: DUF1559 domain-containing protein [Opitutaceae bacterium]|jgi:prepilin-type N-terminal cleavage/methylation domain-containing protein/prepilin-type processing-associated H-X9-DG protein|nr:DUF1559 domain-containing protein [Opitutaceae bacterium]